MAKSAAIFLKELAEKAGIDTTDAAFKDLFENDGLKGVNVPDEYASGINQNLLSLTDAKNNHPAIKSHYFAQALNGVDTEMQRAYSELELDADLIRQLNEEKSSTKRITMLSSKMKNLIEERVAAGKKGSPDVAKLTEQINALNEQLRVEKEGRRNDIANAANEMKKFKTGIILSGKTSGLKTVYDNLPSDVRSTTIETLIGKELNDNNALFVLTDDGMLTVQKKDGSNYFDENNRQLSVDDFISRTLAKHKILQQSGGEPSGHPSAPQPQGQPPLVPAGGQQPQQNYSALFAESLPTGGTQGNGMGFSFD